MLRISYALIFILSVFMTLNSAEVSFTQMPKAEKSGDKVKITFAVNAPTDVAVYIEDANGNIVRHLVAGQLGKKAPAPLQADSLTQTIEWDGKGNWGRTINRGPYKVRVTLGIGAKYDKVAFSDSPALGDFVNMASGPDGTLYVVLAGPKIAHFDSQRLVAINRDGSYQRTLIPVPANTSKEQIEALGGVAATVNGATVPVCISVMSRRTTAFTVNEGLAVSPQGQLLALHCNETVAPQNLRLGILNTTETKTPTNFLGNILFPNEPNAGINSGQRANLAVSTDGKYAYFSGAALRRVVSSDKPVQWSAVYRVKIPERTAAEPFFGDPKVAGNDQTHLGGRAGGMAPDGKGNLLICDPTNQRVVVVSEANGAFVGQFAAEKAEYITVDHKTGNIYLGRVTTKLEIEKLSSWKDPKPLATTSLIAPSSWMTWRMACDTSVTPAVVWASNERQLIRIEEIDNKFSAPATVSSNNFHEFVSLTVDHYRNDPEIYFRKGCNDAWIRYDEKTEKTENIMATELYNSAGAGLAVGPDGNLFIQRWPSFLFKVDRAGKPVKWEEPFEYPQGITPYNTKPVGGNAIYNHVCMNYMPHTLAVHNNGHLFAFESPVQERGPKALVEILPSGKRANSKPLIWQASDSVVGPKFDQQGNIYIAEVVRPLDQLIPPEFSSITGPLSLKSTWDIKQPKAEIGAMYGSIIKFSPKGGMVVLNETKPKPYEGTPTLDPSLKTEDYAFVRGGRDWRAMDTAKVTGAEWVHFGFSHIDHLECNCENNRFDIDLFGRIWYTDLARYCVRVLDTNGNVITSFGGYGNSENCGPDSPVIDPKTKLLRPRKSDDPQDLKSPYTQPELAFSWLTGVGVTDNYVYMTDALNRRLLRAKLTYAASSTCEIK